MLIRYLVSISCACFLLTGCASLDDKDRLLTSHFQNFETWYKINDEPLTGSAGGSLQGKHLEREGIREVYINDIGKLVITGQQNPPFPAGTILVKDTFYSNSDGSKGSRWNITVMRKRAPGYDSRNGDWEYGDAAPVKNLLVVGKWDLCIDCHAFARKDYVFTWD